MTVRGVGPCALLTTMILYSVCYLVPVGSFAISATDRLLEQNVESLEDYRTLDVELLIAAQARPRQAPSGLPDDSRQDAAK